MTVEELIDILGYYNGDAKIGVIAHNREYSFTITVGGADGVKKENATEVHFYVDELCQNEQQKQN